MNTTSGLIKGWLVEWNGRMDGQFDRKTQNETVDK